MNKLTEKTKAALDKYSVAEQVSFLEEIKKHVLENLKEEASNHSSLVEDINNTIKQINGNY